MSPHTNSHHPTEPVALVGGATVLVSLAALVGFDLDPALAAAIITATAGIGAAWARSRVTAPPSRRRRRK